MPRCYSTVKKINKQPDSIQQYKKIKVGSRGNSPERAVGRKVQSYDTNNQKTSRLTNGTRSKKNTENNTSLRAHKPNEMNSMVTTVIKTTTKKLANYCKSSRDNADEWKSTFLQRKKLLNTTNAAVQQQCKNKNTGPTSPTEACVAPSHYNGGVHELKSVCVAIPTESHNKSSNMISTNKQHVTKLWKPEPKNTSPMSIILTNTSTVSVDSIETKTIPTSIAASSAPICRPYQSIVYTQTLNANSNNLAFKTVPTTIITQAKSCALELNDNNQIRNGVHEPNVSHVNCKNHSEYYEPSITTSTTLHSSSDYSMLSLDENKSSDNNASVASVYRERSIEETEAAHDLLSLSQSLPPLPAPCVVTINYLSSHAQEITPSTDYITYTNNDSTTRKIDFTKSDSNSNTNKSDSPTSTIYHSKKFGDIDGSLMLPDRNKSTERSRSYNTKSRVTPPTPPTSESSSSSSSDIEYSTESSFGANRRAKHVSQLSSKYEKCPEQKSKSAQVFGMTIFDAVMINDGRSKKGNGEAEVIHVEERRKGRYKCPQCGKQYATSSNLSRHKQTHRSLDSQSAKKCNTCGKAYVSMPALAMHLLTHKLTHSCDVCGKLFSRPWLLQGHLRSHTGEKPYGCAHCGKAFADRSNLRAHMQTHSINKAFECTRCRKTFALKSYLNKHLESSCLRDEFKKCYDSKKSSGSVDEANAPLSMDEDSIDVGCD